MIGRLVTAKLVTWAELKSGVYTWDDIWAIHDMLDLDDWLEWQHHAAAEQDR